MVTYQQLLAADPASWAAAAAAWRGLGPLLRHRAEVVGAGQAELAAVWRGTAGAAAGQHVARLGARLRAGEPVCVQTDQVLAEYAVALAQARAMLDAAVASAAGTAVTVAADGRVGFTGLPEHHTLTIAGRVAAGIRAALRAAARADAVAAARLAELAAWGATGWVAVPAPGPPPQHGPGGVRRWWDGLTLAQRQWLIQHQPETVATLDGVPTTGRDQANRVLLALRQSTLTERAAAIAAELAAAAPGLSRQWPQAVLRAELDQVEAQLATLDRVAHRLEANSPRGYLLGLDPARDGRVILAVGNPDQADNVVVHVPGTGATLAGMDTELSRATATAQRATALAPEQSTAAVLWLDYDAPDWPLQPTRSSFAESGAAALSDFAAGLRATADGGDPTRVSVVGHSYGSLLVGVAARDHGLDADALIFVGSPGVGASRVDDLGVAADDVWASTARWDPIQHVAPSLSHAARDAALEVIVPRYGHWAFGQPDTDLWHGRNPGHHGFGAQLFGSDPSPGFFAAHSSYWDRDNPALDNMARIALGGDHLAGVR